MFKKIKLMEWQAILLFSFIFTYIQNIAFWMNSYSLLSNNFVSNLYFYIAMQIFVFCIMNIVLSLIFWQRTKFLIGVFLLIGACVTYFSYNFNMYIDLHMLVNVEETNWGEATTLITPYFLLWLVFIFLLPCIVLFNLKFHKQYVSKRIKIRLLIMFCSLATLCITSLPIYSSYASFFRNHNQIIKQLTPSNYLVASTKFAQKKLEKPIPFRTIADDAKQVSRNNIDSLKTASELKPRLLILVVGETSRATNFSLNGYPKLTNPKLSQITELINYPHATSCGTATAISVPCMFSNLTRENYNERIAKSQENVLDILQKSGLSLLWRENDGGCKGVCERIPTDAIVQLVEPTECPTELCYDEHILDNLQEFIAAQTKDTVIVLHTNGSHGPAYYQRYPDSLEGKFTPTCDTNQIQSCNNESLENTYDNTILHIDTVLEKTIRLLSVQSKFSTAMIYLSDHGESLGEHGLYLHAAPYSIAPEMQTHIPFITWFSPNWLEQEKLDLSCLQTYAKENSVSQDNLFHTLLGLFDISTKEYNPLLDLNNACKKGA